MTTVVGLARPEGVWMSADTGTNVFDRPVVGLQKIWPLCSSKGNTVALLGISGPAAACNVLPAVFAEDLVEPLGNTDPDRWAYGIAAQLTRAMVDAGLIVPSGQMEGAMLLGVPGHLWTIDHHLAMRSPDGRGSVGSGEAVAMGALDALMKHVKKPPATLVHLAAAIAVDRDRWSQLPLQHVSLLADEEQGRDVR